MTGPAFFAPVYLDQYIPTRAQTGSASLHIPTLSLHRSVRPPPAPRTIPIPLPAVTLTTPTPIPSPPHSPPPPSYSTPLSRSPPKYLPFPSSQETALLLAPPPAFTAQPICFICDPEGILECRHSQRREHSDWVVRALIVLNLLVWALVIWGYWSQWSGDRLGNNGGEWMPGGLDGGWGLESTHEDVRAGDCTRKACTWSFVY
jgi:hypothetical protein